MQPSSAYDEARARVLELLRIAPDTPVPATPAWSVRDVVAHMSGLAVAWVEGGLDGYASEQWTSAQVEERRGMSVEALAEEWSLAGARLVALLDDPAEIDAPDPLLTAFGPMPRVAWPGVILTDTAVHEHDIRGALGRPGARDSDAVMIAMRSHVGLLRFIGAARKLPNLVLAPTDHDRPYKIGRGPAEATVAAPLFELFRATGGRRSLDQIRAMDWEGEYEPWIDQLVLPTYRAPEQPLIEPDDARAGG